MLHIDPATLRRHPILGVVIGGATAAVLVFLIQAGWGEANALIGQPAPDRLTLHQALNLHGTRWITVTDGQWHCERTITLERSVGVERWVRGSIDATEVPLTSAVQGELLVARFDGAIRCAERSSSSLTGVIGSTEIFTSRGALRRWGHGGNRVAVLHVGATPRIALIMLVTLGAIAILGAGFAVYSLSLMVRATDRPHSPTAPIEPS